MKIEVKSLQETKELATIFAQSLDENGLFVTLTGDIGAGKTQFVRYVLEELKVKEKITSPSFVILNEYKCDLCPIYHFDLYRLEEKGLKSIVSELREYSKNKKLTFIEWAEFGLEEIPNNALNINVEYDENDLDIRYFSFTSEAKENIDFIEKLSKRIKNEHSCNLRSIK
ncbi:tRNA (adenosine(37)-N6)-threonylcarbamoyltransferase complex ATPase subunit type 1 TsaE [bacterium]|nr:tRNA (adenosine(37)-N6)-threonylcarbamoyltransferase complex ATPase subunit type 1 TsaE [bacterium]MBQ9150030.1 tRNA (adenosine(37)-N6)-threonylcarbamoyltransferase complex ATPase subunit type 1 TsaE [bacterium]